MIQNLLVAVLVIAAMVFSVWRLMPLKGRLRVLEALEPALGGVVPLQRARAKALAQLSGGCGACAGGAGHRRHLRAVKH